MGCFAVFNFPVVIHKRHGTMEKDQEEEGQNPYPINIIPPILADFVA
jgi:hypothetical protein